MKVKGEAFESLACDYLQKAGLQLLARNFRLGHWEVDLIMKDGSTFVFVEVKYRKNEHYGGAAAALSHSQRARLRSTAQAYLQQNRLREEKTQCRFDLIAITGHPISPTIEWLKNAF